MPATADAMSVAERRAMGFPVGEAGWHGESSIAAAIRSGVIPRNSPLETVVRSLQSPSPAGGVDDGDRGARDAEREPSVSAGRRLRSRFRDLRRHFVFEYYPWYQTHPYDHWSEE